MAPSAEEVQAPSQTYAESISKPNIKPYTNGVHIINGTGTTDGTNGTNNTNGTNGTSADIKDDSEIPSIESIVLDPEPGIQQRVSSLKDTLRSDTFTPHSSLPGGPQAKSQAKVRTYTDDPDRQQFPRISRPVELMREVYDVVVIGSGYGGGVAAARMARGEQSVCLLERGKEKWRKFGKSLLKSEYTNGLSWRISE